MGRKRNKRAFVSVDANSYQGTRVRRKNVELRINAGSQKTGELAKGHELILGFQ